MNDVGSASAERPRWRKIVDFPLISMLIALAIVFVSFIVAVPIGQFLVAPVTGLSFELNVDLVSIPLLIAAYKLVIRHLGEYPRDDYRDRHALRRLGLGLGIGFVVFSLAVALSAAIGIYHVSGEGDASDLFPALIGPALFAAVSEELIFRGIIFRWVEEFGGSWVALAASSAAFGAVHLTNPNSSTIAAVGIALEAGLLLGAAYMLTRSLWMPMGIHAAWNFAQGEVYDIPVSGIPVHGLLVARLSGPPLLSGNGFGLEASPIGIAVGTLSGLALLWLAIWRGQVIPPAWARQNRVV